MASSFQGVPAAMNAEYAAGVHANVKQGVNPVTALLQFGAANFTHMHDD
jgi:hypothetical protein